MAKKKKLGEKEKIEILNEKIMSLTGKLMEKKSFIIKKYLQRKLKAVSEEKIALQKKYF